MKYQPTHPHADCPPVMHNTILPAPEDYDEMPDPYRYLTCTCGAIEGMPADQSRGQFQGFTATESQESPDGMTYSCLTCKNPDNTITVDIEDQPKDEP